MAVPGYEFLKKLTSGFGPAGEVSGFKPAWKLLPGGGFQAAYLIEEGSSGWCAILLPHAAAAMSGPVEVLPRERVRMVDGRFNQFMQSLNHWGSGIDQLLPPSSRTS